MLRTVIFTLALFVTSVAGHGKGIVVNNPELGVAGFPDCVRAHPLLDLSMEAAGMDLLCSQVGRNTSAIKIATIGDSITAGACSSGGDAPYPQQMQIMLDQEHGEGAYAVTNLGACGSTMQKEADSPYWERPQYDALTAGTWDIVVIMLGTNDAKDPGSQGPDNWQHDCGGPYQTTTEGCRFADDYRSMIEVVKTLGNPTIYAMVPPPLMQVYAIGANQTVINTVYPQLIPMIVEENEGTKGPIDVFNGMGGNPPWYEVGSPSDAGCALDDDNDWSPCGWWCDAQSCDECHPNGRQCTCTP